MSETEYSAEYLAESKGMEVTVVAWVFTGLAIVIVGTKLFTTGHMRKAMGWDDAFIFISMIMSIFASICVQVSAAYGLGRHVPWVVQQGLQQLADCLMWQTLGFPFNILAFSLPNISIAILIERLLQRNKVRTVCMYAMVWLQVILSCVAVILYFAQCTPTKYIWDAARVPGKCWSDAVFFNFYYFFSSYTAVTDLILALVPITAFWQLQMKTSTRIGLCVMMALTLLSAIVTVVKTCYVNLLSQRADLLYAVIPLVEWGLIEQNVVIIAACVPTLRPFFNSFGGKFRSGTGSKLSGSQGSKVLSRSHLSSGRIRLESGSEVELNDRDSDRQDAESSTSDPLTHDKARDKARGKNIVRTVHVNVDVSDLKGPPDPAVKAHW